MVTGLGAVSAAGEGVGRFWSACVEGRAALRPIRRFDARPYGDPRAGECRLDPGAAAGDAPAPAAAAAALPGADATVRFARGAAREALRSAGLEGTALPSGSGIAIGTCLGSARPAFDWHARGGVRRDSAADAPPPPGSLFAGPALALASAHGADGPVLTVSTACASGTSAIALGAAAIRSGEADLVLAGGADALSEFVLSGFHLLRALTLTEVRPFDRRRDGLALGEGAGLLVLEERAAAGRRGAPILAEILGSGSAGDAHHMTGPAPDGGGVARALGAALADAGLEAAAIDAISAHGTGTPYNDRMESLAIRRVFGTRAGALPVNSIKPIIGHTLGAAGALEAILCVLMLRHAVVPPTLNYGEPDPECDLDYVPGRARPIPLRRVISTSSAFAGCNAALVVGTP